MVYRRCWIPENYFFLLKGLNHMLTNYEVNTPFFKKNNFKKKITIKNNYKTINFFLKNFSHETYKFFFFKKFLHFYRILVILLENNFNFFFFNANVHGLNTNILNLNFFNNLVFNKNLFFFFFSFSWIKSNPKKDKFVAFIMKFNVKFLFFFKLTYNANLLNFLTETGLFLSGFNDTKKHLKFFDYPLQLNENNTLHIYITYIFFVKLFLERNKNKFFFLKNYYFFNYFFDFN